MCVSLFFILLTCTVAAEIAGKFGKDFGKKVILYSKSERLLPGMDARAGAFATEWLKSNGVEIRAGECGPTATTSTTSSEEKGGERVVFTCYGSARNVDFECPLSRSSRGGILVKGTMQVSSEPTLCPPTLPSVCIVW